MPKNVIYVSHKKNKQKNQDGSPKLPVASALVEGEIAINFAENVETISILNESGHVVTFSSDNYYSEKKLGSAFTGANSAVTVTDVIEENEEIISSALNDLEGRKLDASAYTPSVELWEAGTGENSVVLKNSNNVASGISSVAEGSGTTASGNYSHSEGNNTTASGQSSHAEGLSTLASGYYSHAEGSGTLASGWYSHAEGSNTVASGYCSHAEGRETIAKNQYEHASGQYNISSSASTTFGDSGNTLFSVGNGDDVTRHNAFEIRQNGDIYIVSGNTDIKLQDNLGGNITVDQVLDNTTSASTNPVSSKAVYDAIVDNELVWTNAYVAMSGAVSAHTANTEMHVTAADKEKLHTHSNKAALDSITGNVGTMAYEDKASYSSATEVNTALGGKANTASTLAGYGITNAYTKSETSGATELSTEFAKYYTTAQTSGATELSTAFDAIDDLVGSGFTSSSITDVIIENERIVSDALNDLDDRKLDASAYTPTDLTNYYTKSQTSGATEISTALSGKLGTSEYATFSAATNASINDLSGQSETIAAALNDLNGRKLDASAYTPTDLSNYYTKSETSGATELTTAFSAKADKTSDLDGVKLKKITQSAYDALVQAGTVDPNTLYIITD